jgi:hypothetical protein
VHAHLVDQTAAFIRGILPTEAVTIVADADATRLELPSAPGAEYSFQLWCYADGERNIHADLIADPEQRFWYHPFELEDFDRDPVKVAAATERELLLLVSRRTRVRINRGWVFWNFVLEAETASGEWERVSGYGLLRGNPAPLATGDSAIYHAPPLVARTSVTGA